MQTPSVKRSTTFFAFWMAWKSSNSMWVSSTSAFTNSLTSSSLLFLLPFTNFRNSSLKHWWRIWRCVSSSEYLYVQKRHPAGEELAFLLEVHYCLGKLNWQRTESRMRIVHRLHVGAQLHQSAYWEYNYLLFYWKVSTNQNIPLAIQFG